MLTDLWGAGWAMHAGADVLVATPGRLGDLLERYDVFDMRELEVSGRRPVRTHTTQ